MHSRAFDKAVAKYRKRAASKATKAASRAEHSTQRATNASDMTAEGGAAETAEPDPSGLVLTASKLEEVQAQTQRHLEALPHEIIHRARTFHDYMQYFAGGRGRDLPGEGPQTNVPDELRKLLDEIARSEGIGERVKRDILHDNDAKNVRPPVPIHDRLVFTK